MTSFMVGYTGGLDIARTRRRTAAVLPPTMRLVTNTTMIRGARVIGRVPDTQENPDASGDQLSLRPPRRGPLTFVDPRLILLNGPPACGKSTLARWFVEDHPPALDLDIDRVRDLIGGWRDDPRGGGVLARRIALAAAREHLAAGHDVVVPQLLARPEFIDELAALHRPFHEIVLIDSLENSLRRFRARGDGGDPDEVRALYGRLMTMLATRPAARLIHVEDAQADRAYRDFLAIIDPSRNR